MNSVKYPEWPKDSNGEFRDEFTMKIRAPDRRKGPRREDEISYEQEMEDKYAAAIKALVEKEKENVRLRSKLAALEKNG